MGLGQRTARHETVAAAKVGARSEDFWEYRPGQRVMTKDGFPGQVVAVVDGPFAGNEEYEVRLDNGMGGGSYTASLLRSMPQSTANVDAATAASDYPELAEILVERPPLAASVTASRKTAIEALDPKDYEKGGKYEQKQCGCEHVNHFSDDEPAIKGTSLEGHPRTPGAHEYGAVPPGDQVARHVGRVCDWCAENCMKQYLLPKQAAGFTPHEHPETGDWHGSPSECEGTMCTSEHNPENDPSRHAPDHIRQTMRKRFDTDDEVHVHPDKPNTYVVNPHNTWDGPTHVQQHDDNDFSFDGWTGHQHFDTEGHKIPCSCGHTGSLTRQEEFANAVVETYEALSGEQMPRYVATDHFGDPDYTDSGTCPNCHSKGRVLKSSTGYMKCEDCGHAWGKNFSQDYESQHGKAHVPSTHHRGSAQAAEPIVHKDTMGATCKDCGFGHYDKKPGDVCPLCDGQMSRMPEKYASALLDDPWRMLVVATTSPEFRFEVTASFADVREKAKRLRQEGMVNIISVSDGSVAANVKGEHGVYETVLTRTPGSKQSIAQWTCGCKWASYAWGRTGAYKRFEGRLCSHALAVQYEASSRGMFGRSIDEDQKAPNWLTPRTRIVTDYDKDTGRNVSRPAAPRQRDLNRTYSAKEQIGDPSPVALLVAEALLQGEDPAEVVFALRTAGIEGAPFIHIAAQVTASDPQKTSLPTSGDQAPCSRSICGHPEGVHGGEHTDCQAAGCKCPRFQGGGAGRTANLDVEARHPKHHPSHHHPHHGHSTPFHGVGIWGGWGGFGYGYGPGGFDGGGYMGGGGPTDSGSGGTGSDDGAGSSGDAGGGDGGATASLHTANPVQPESPEDYTPWKATQPPVLDQNPASTGWASSGDPKDWGVAVDNAGQRLGAIDDALFEPEIEKTALPLLALAPELLAGAEVAGGAAAAGEGAAVAGEAGEAAAGGRGGLNKVLQPAQQAQQPQNGQQQPQQPKTQFGAPPTNIGHDTDPYSLNRVVQHASLDEEPEPALPSTDGADDLDEPVGSATASLGESVEDIVANFQRTAGQAIMTGDTAAPGEGSGDIAAMARAFLDTGQLPVEPSMSATAMKTFSPAEQRQIIDEGLDVKASNLDRLDIAGTHYEALDAALATVGDPDDDGDLWS